MSSNGLWERTIRLLAVVANLALMFGLFPFLSSASPPQVHVDSQGFAMGGFDVVAYFTEATARKGRPEFEVQHEGARYRFASAANQALFQVAPDKYLPQFRGYCAYAMAAGKTRKCDPRRFMVKEGTLLVFSSESARRQWSRDEATLLAKAMAFWRELIR